MKRFDDREKAEEQRFAKTAEMEFKIMARRNKALGAWAAELLGLSGAQAEDYAKQVIAADFDEPGDEDVFRKVRGDFDAQSVDISDAQLRAAMDRFLAQARTQLANE